MYFAQAAVLVPLDADSPADRAVALRIARECEALVGVTETTDEEIVSLSTGPESVRDAHRLALPYASADRDEAVGALLVDSFDRLGREMFLTPFAIGEQAEDVYGQLISDGIDTTRRLTADDDNAGAPFDGDPYVPSAGLWQVTLGLFRGEQEFAAAAERLGFRHIRSFYRMWMSLDGRSVQASMRSDLSLRVVRSDDDMRTLHRLRNETFADHFGSTHDRPFVEWVANLRALPGFDAERLFIVSRSGIGDELRDIGLLIMDNSRVQEGGDYLRTIGVVADERRGGVGRWVMEQAIGMALARGAATLSLGVDTGNTSNATALYESVGMTPRHVIDVYTRPLDDALVHH